MKTYLKALLFLAILSLSSCGTTHYLKRDFVKNRKDANFFKGFVLYNPKTGKEIINHNGSKYFTPASNTKLYTFYAAYKTLSDSIKGLEYTVQGDTLLLIKGTADPSLLYEFENSKTIDFLNNHEGMISIIDASLDDNKFGSGWSWGDYQYYYMPEKSLFPIYGNVATYSMDNDSIISEPSYFTEHIEILDSVEINREFNSNQFYLEKADTTSNYIPFRTSTKLVAQLLSDTLQKPISVVSGLNDLFVNTEYKTLYSVLADSVYKQLLVVSDNFIAEQLMLQVGKEVSGKYNVEEGIDYVLENHLSTLPHPPRWVDGSGLSRYNLFTPEDTVHLLTKMYNEIPFDKLISYFPVGGETGTLRNWYANKTPYVYAKSGTLSNNYSLSGYLITKKGTVLIFSYMNNHYRLTNSEIRTQIQDHLFKIYNTY